MPRPTHLDLTAAVQPWRRVPMGGAESGIDVVPLACHADDFVLLARFPAGFIRSRPGGYHAAETFLVLEGALHLDDREVGRGDLTHVPAEHVRGPMATEVGCTALAWFSGPATFVPPESLGACALSVTTVALTGRGAGTVLQTPEAVWSIDSETHGEAVDVDLTAWALTAAGRPGPLLVRSRR